jgi:hypothetical protein
MDLYGVATIMSPFFVSPEAANLRLAHEMVELNEKLLKQVEYWKNLATLTQNVVDTQEKLIKALENKIADKVAECGRQQVAAQFWRNQAEKR